MNLKLPQNVEDCQNIFRRKPRNSFSTKYFKISQELVNSYLYLFIYSINYFGQESIQKILHTFESFGFFFLPLFFILVELN